MDYNSQSKITEENYNPKIHVAEIKRTCNQCGMVWHVLAGREKQLAKNMCLDSCGLCGTCGSPHQAQYSHNFDSNHNELLETKKCPNCKSSNYEEEMVYYNK